MTDTNSFDAVTEQATGRKPWVAPALIASDVQDTANNNLPTFIESTTPTDRPS
ncbi:hypothetical protein [Sphingomonas sp.]|uniref:hypothetical protein n=1 Tax=Sphingomonas sp. TaxID=28214 RepID=UPI003BA91E52